MALLIGHWQLLGHGLFVVEERATGAFLGRVGPLQPPGYPGFEIAWGLAPAARGKGYAQEAARAAIDWSFATSSRSTGSSRSSTRSTPPASASPSASASAAPREQFAPFHDPCDIWEMRREDW